MPVQEVTKRLPAEKNTTAPDNNRCAVTATLRLFATKWKPCILCYLEYRLSPKGRSILDLLTAIQDWGLANLSGVLSIDQMVQRAGF